MKITQDEAAWENICGMPGMQLPNNRNLNVNINITGVSAEQMVGSPVYVSLATISTRIDVVHKTVHSILKGTVVPTHIYLFISRHPYLIDQGVKPENLPHSLLSLCHNFPVSLVYTKNIGPHRKLLPLLKRTKEQNLDAVIVSGDDDREYSPLFLQNLVTYYLASQKRSVIAYRARRVALCQQYPHNPVAYGEY